MSAADGRTISRDGVELRLECFGSLDDAPILLIAGAASSMDAWDEAFCARLAAGGRFVVRYDHRDTGGSSTSPVGAPSYTAADLTNDPLRILDALGLGAAHLVGVSMGGGIAQQLAAEQSDRVLSITLISTSPAGRRRDASPLPGPAPAVAASFGEPPPSADDDDDDPEKIVDQMVRAERPFAGGAGFDEAHVRLAARRTVARAIDPASAPNHFLVLDGGDDAGDGAEDSGFAMSEIAVPTLVIHGTDDPLFPIEHGRSLAREIDGATLIELPGGGHEHPTPRSWDIVAPAILTHTSD